MPEVTIELPDYVDFMCYRMSTAPTLESLVLKGKGLKLDIDRKEDYTLVEGGIDRLRAAYKKRHDELKTSPIGDKTN